MSLAWSSVKALSIPVGGVSRDVKRVTAGGVTLWEKPNPLPYDAEVEYIESTGTQWIDTGIVPKTTGVWEFDIKFSSSGDLRFAGVGTTSSIAILSIGLQSSSTTNHIPYCYSSWNDSKRTSVSPTTRHTLRYEFMPSDQKLYYNGVLHKSSNKTAPNLSSSNTMALFACKAENGTPQPYMTRHVFLYGCKIWNLTTLVRNFIPVRVGSGSSAVGYLYDKANPTGGPSGNGLYGNSGTGAFVVGPDKGASLSMSPFLELVETDLNPLDADATESEAQEEPQES